MKDNRLEILFVNLTVYDSKNKPKRLEKVVITRGDQYYKNQYIIEVEEIKILGLQNSKGYENR